MPAPAVMSTDAPIMRLLEQLVEGQETMRRELREFRAELARRRRRPVRAGVLPAILAVVEHRAFTAEEVIAHCEIDPALAAALDAGAIATARTLGQYLSYRETHPRGPVRVFRLGEDGDGIIWRVEYRSSD
jgi:hypothetical protein